MEREKKDTKSSTEWKGRNFGEGSVTRSPDLTKNFVKKRNFFPLPTKAFEELKNKWARTRDEQRNWNFRPLELDLLVCMTEPRTIKIKLGTFYPAQRQSKGSHFRERKKMYAWYSFWQISLWFLKFAIPSDSFFDRIEDKSRSFVIFPIKISL